MQLRPVGVDADTDSVIVPANPLTCCTVTVELPVLPARIWVGDTLPATSEKSTKWNTMLDVVCERVPVVPVTVTVKSPVVTAVQDNAAVWGEIPKLTLG